MCRVTMQSDSIVSSSEEFTVLMKALTADITSATPQSPPKRVRFSAELCFSAPTAPLTREEKNASFYDASTISSFRSEARKIATSMKKQNNCNSVNTRGLESCTFERQLQRHKTRQCMLSSCQKGYTAEQTAAMAQKCSQWNRDVALMQACHDFFQVYQPSMPLPNISQTPPAFPFELKRASSSACGGAQQPTRRVRRRISV